MGLMARDVEITDAKREVHRVDVCESWRKKREVRGEEQAGERRERCFHKVN